MSMMSNILAMSEGATGFSGGSAVDEYPHMSLTEAAATVSTLIAESQLSWVEETQTNNETLVESITSAIATGVPLDESGMIKGALANIKNKVIALFNKIKKIINSIIAKLKLFIDGIFKSNKQLVNRYGKDSAITNKKLTNFKFNGFKYIDDIGGAFKVDSYSSESGVDTLVDISTDKKFPLCDIGKYTGKGIWDDKIQEDFDTRLSEWKDISADDQQAKCLATLTGLSITTKSEAVKTMVEYLQGDTSEKSELSISDFGDYIKRMENPADLNHMNDSYKKLAKMCEDCTKRYTKMIDSCTDTINDSDADVTAKKHSSANASYFDHYVNVIANVVKSITEVAGVKLEVTKRKMAQDKALFLAVHNYNDKKDNNDAASEDDIAFYDFDI